MNGYPFRLGTTSYIIPDDIIPNVRYLAGRVQDVELVLFEVDDGPNNMPGKKQISELRRLAADHDLTYTVHLPLDLRLADDGSSRHASLTKARRVIDRTLELDPWAYVLHLDGRSVRGCAGREARRRWEEQAVRSLELAGVWAGGAEKLAVENLEGYPPDFYEPVLDRIAASRAVDIGHLWLDGHDPAAYLRGALARTRVVHIHGVAGRDHQSLAQMPQEMLGPAIDELIRADYRGVVTLEVFSEDDFLTSCAAMEAVLNENIEQRGATTPAGGKPLVLKEGINES